MATKANVGVVGLKELRRDLIRLDSSYFPKAFVAAGQTVAEPVAGRMRSALPHDSGDLSGSVRVGRNRTGATIRFGSAMAPYAGPVEFGGYPGERRFVRDGRYAYPAAQGMAPQAADAYGREIQKAIDRYPWETPR